MKEQERYVSLHDSMSRYMSVAKLMTVHARVIHCTALLVHARVMHCCIFADINLSEL